MMALLLGVALAADPVLVVAVDGQGPLVRRLEAELALVGLPTKQLSFDPAPSALLSYQHAARAVVRVEPELVSLWTPGRGEHLVLSLDAGTLGLSAAEALRGALRRHIGPDFSPQPVPGGPVRPLATAVLLSLFASSPVLATPQSAGPGAERRLASITLLEEVLSKGADLDQRPEMMMRLAELYLDQAQALHLEEMERELACEDCEVERVSQQWRERGLRLYTLLTTHYPRFSRVDEALYYLALAQEDAGLPQAHVQTATRLVRQYPDSEWATDAWVKLGEAYFAQDDAVTARRAYAHAAADAGHPMQVFATYKLGWCLYNLGEYDEAIAALQRVVARGDEGLGQREEALRDLVRFFADADRLEDAEAYFNRLGQPQRTLALMKRMAELAAEQGKHTQAVHLYRRLLAADPGAADAVGHQLAILDLLRQQGDAELVHSELVRALQRWGPASDWAKAQAADDRDEAGRELARFTRRVAFEAHKRARKLGTGSRHDAARALAAAGYALFLEHFPEDAQASEVRYAAGELAWDERDYALALAMYTRVTEGPRARFCAEAAIHAAEALVKQAPAEDMGPDEAALLAASDAFLQRYPNDEIAQAVAFKAARLLYDRRQPDAACERFAEVVAMDPASERAEQAAHLSLDTLVQRKDWQTLHDQARAFLEATELGSPAFKGEMMAIVQRSGFRIAQQQYADDGDPARAAHGLQVWLEEFEPHAEASLVAKALHNASVYFQEAGMPEEAQRLRLRLVDDPRSSVDTPHYADQLLAAGFYLEGLARFAEAAARYEQLVDEAPLHPGAADALFSAAVFRRALGELDAAAADFASFSDAFAGDGRASESALAEALCLAEAGRSAAAETALAAYARRSDLTPEHVAYAQLRRGELLGSLGRQQEQKRLYNDAVVAWQSLEAPEPGHTQVAAEMMYVLAGPSLRQYLDARIGSDATGSLEDSLRSKAQRLSVVESSMTSILRTGAGRWGLASLLALGTAYEDMGRALLEAEVPAELTPQQRRLYLDGIEREVFSFEERAVQAYSAALQKSHELGLYGDFAGEALERLAVLRPEEHPRIEEVLPRPRFTAP